ncbi:low specificity L-threonine aldolase [Reyranella sp. CPCC 100927]|uniref:threonine aldolase family protein n=1 Tax=Reyranella sp. CPCC 100927 TaxID=2599616 RepID=UPI0011B7ED7A|nr:beta-eliminating lyase-related protein [Reyranella sp. CPCC 100927]TWS99611.1 low specificity L-threonine aldolase [Reyranella sp. CPCC 100927]
MPSLDFRSDNVGAVAPQIMSAVMRVNADTADGYGRDPFTKSLAHIYAQAFDADVAVFPVATGTAANAVALSVLTPPYGAVLCHPTAHINVSECGAPEFFTGGAKIVPVPGPDGRIDPSELRRALDRAGMGQPHRVQPAALSLTQPTDLGTVYALDVLAELCAIAKDHGLRIHMDGARLANAVAALGCSLADATWRCGVDILSFGVTKNGGMNADAIIAFDRRFGVPLAFRLRRAGQTFSKMRYAAAQLAAYVENDLYRHLASHANALSARLAGRLADTDIPLVAPVEANEVFAYMPPPVVRSLESVALFHRYPDDVVRFVCRWDSCAADVDLLAHVIAQRGSAEASP